MERAACKVVREGSELVRVELRKKREARNRARRDWGRDLPSRTTCVDSHKRDAGRPERNAVFPVRGVKV